MVNIKDRYTGKLIKRVTDVEIDLINADLRWADLSRADLKWANLSEADLRWADLRWADLSNANLSRANLRWADLSEADLRWADLSRADLSGTCLDPENKPNNPKEFKSGIGYRTRKAGHIDKYRDGRIYSADIFSTCPETGCHPGLYLWPTLEQAKNWSFNGEYIKVKTDKADIHKAGSKYRCRWFKVIGKAE